MPLVSVHWRLSFPRYANFSNRYFIKPWRGSRLRSSSRKTTWHLRVATIKKLLVQILHVSLHICGGWLVASGYRKNDSSPTFLGPCLAFLFPNSNFTTWSPSIISIDLGKEQSHHAISKIKQKYNNKFKIDTTK
jgi:hypothetical protein